MEFERVLVMMVHQQRLLGQRLSTFQELYLEALGVTGSLFNQPVGTRSSP